MIYNREKVIKTTMKNYSILQKKERSVWQFFLKSAFFDHQSVG